MTLSKPTLALIALGLWSGCAQMGQFAPPMAGSSNSSSQSSSSTQPETSPAAPAEASETEAPKAAGPSTVSVSIKNNCGKTAKIFYGAKPKFGSGTYSTLGSNTRTNHTFRPGDAFWVVDDGQNGLDSVEVSEGTKEIEIQGGCDKLASR